MKKNSIVRKLIVTFSSITGGVLILVGLIISFWFYGSNEKQKVETLNEQLNIVSEAIGQFFKYQEGSYDNVNRLLKIASLTNNMDGIIIDRLGYVYMVSDEKYNSLKYNSIDISPGVLPTSDKLEHIKTLKSKDVNAKSGAYVKAIYSNDQLDGYIIMLSSNQQDKKHMIIIIWTSIIFAIIIAAAIVKYFAELLVIEPIEEINNAAKRLAKGDVKKRVEIVGNDEIGELGQSFNRMATAIEESDNTRKQFISNVSHELRSPITSIKGFIGGIIDGVIPRDKENYYLKIVYDEIDRLARLVNDLLDISAMEAGKFNLNILEFDLNQTISLCILNLESKINAKRLNVKATFRDEKCFVVADRDRIIQVITNLLENSIKYTNEDGQIEVRISVKGEKVFVNIFNSGENISEEDINHIWERFYKSDKSRTNKISTGLGLPIVRLILSQHNEDVWVNNIEGKGVEFTFTLTRNV